LRRQGQHIEYKVQNRITNYRKGYERVMEELLRIYSKFTHKTGHSFTAERSWLQLYIISPLSAGIFGFAVFFFFVILFEAVAHFFGIISVFSIGTVEVSIALIGFALQFILQLLNPSR
jgi:hypothetical protein